MISLRKENAVAAKSRGRQPQIRWLRLNAFTQMAANRGAAGVDHVTIVEYANDLDANPGLRRGRLWRA
jgi:hypothetical protein